METVIVQNGILGGVPAHAGAREAVQVEQADNDAQLMGLWLHGRSMATQRAYAADVRTFLDFAGVPLHGVTLGMLQSWADSLKDRAPASQARAIASVKSLFSFAHRLGYLPFDTGAPLRSPRLKDRLSERILPEADVQRMLAIETDVRNRVLLRLLYASGMRVSEISALTWADCTARDGDQGQITVFGKGGKTRQILLSVPTWKEIVAIKRDGAAPGDPVFVSRKGGALDQSMINRIVHAAAQRAGIDAAVSPHWLRHAHASHAIDRGAPVSLVQATLGHSSMATTGRYLHARPNDSSSRYLAV